MTQAKQRKQRLMPREGFVKHSASEYHFHKHALQPVTKRAASIAAE
jgi:hypothetical protein